MFDPKKFTIAAPKPLPVIFLLDISGSMGEIIDDSNTIDTGRMEFIDGKNYHIVEGGISRIQVLNDCCRKMMDSFTSDSSREIEIECAIITFGEDVRLHLPLTPAASVHWADMEPDGDTPMGRAFQLASKIIEDKTIIPSRAYRPAVILVSDGCPTDSWEQPLEDFIRNGRSSKCDRMALGIGDDADCNVLNKFVEGTGHPVFTADDSDKIHEFFKYVTMSVSVRSHSINPNVIPVPMNETEEASEPPRVETQSDDDYF